MSVMLQRCTRSQYVTSHFFVRTYSARYFGGLLAPLNYVRRRIHSDDCQRLTSVKAPSRQFLVDERRTFVQLVQCPLARYPCECEHGFVRSFHLVYQCRKTFRLTLPRLFLCSFLSARNGLSLTRSPSFNTGKSLARLL